MPAKAAPKTREEIVADFENDLIELHGMTIVVDGHPPLEFLRDMEDMPQRLHFILPEYATYTLTVRFRTPNKQLLKLRYRQLVKKAGVTLNSRDHLLCDATTAGEMHSVTLPPETLPGGALLRGVYPATLKFCEDDDTVLRCKWTIELVNKKKAPAIGGFD